MGAAGLFLLAVLAGVSGEGGDVQATSGSATRPNVLLITLDTTRADRLGCYGCSKGLTPNLDALASKGVVFDRAIAQASVTPVSHASILTGLNPYTHGLRVMHGKTMNRLSEAKVTMAEVLERAGYHTAAFVSAFPVSERFGLDQGFDTFDADFGDVNLDNVIGPDGAVSTGLVQRRAGDTTNRALTWLQHCSEPYFVWVHYFDPHDPYLLPPKEFQPGDLSDPEALGPLRPTLLAIYDAEVRYMDSCLGRLLEALDRSGAADRTVIVVVADHGEGLGDHDWWTHGLLYQEQIGVPLIVRAGGIRGGRRITEVVRTIDIMPTVLELVRVNAGDLPAMEGVSLVGRLGGQPADQGLVAYSDSVNVMTYSFLKGISDHKDDMLFGVVDWPWKYVHHRRRPDESELYHLDDDPGELHNLIREHPDQTRRMIDLLRSRDFLPGDEPDTGQMSPEEIEKLKSLGYIK